MLIEILFPFLDINLMALWYAISADLCYLQQHNTSTWRCYLCSTYGTSIKQITLLSALSAPDLRIYLNKSSTWAAYIPIKLFGY